MIHDNFKYEGYENSFTLCEMGFGDVAFGCSKKNKEDGHVALSFRSQIPERIGSVKEHGLTDGEYINKIELLFIFHNVECIDALISELENAKNNLRG